MKIEHVALWARDLESLKDFYVRWFGASAGDRHENAAHGFRSYFLAFESGPRLELMQMPGILVPGAREGRQSLGLAHFAVQVADRSAVIELTERLRLGGVRVASEPHLTGDGYFESCVFDPENNRVEITA